MTSSDSKFEKVQTHSQTLASVATSLNAASDELTKVVALLDEPLKKLNLGLTVWVTFRSRAVEEWEYDDDQIGYAKVNGKWGIALQRIWGDNRAAHYDGEGPWLFNDAPRDMRVAGVDQIPEVIEALGKEAFETTKKVQEKTEEIRSLASVIEKMASEPRRTERPKKAERVISVGLSSEQITAILAGVRHQQKFLGELVAGASRWELNAADLLINFPPEKHAFAEMLNGRESLAKLKVVVGQVLGRPVRVTVSSEQPAVIESTANNNKGGR